MSAPLASPSPGRDAMPPADSAPGNYAIKVRWKDSFPNQPKLPLPQYEDDFREAQRIACRLTRWQRKEAEVVRVADGRVMGWADSGEWVAAASGRGAA